MVNIDKIIEKMSLRDKIAQLSQMNCNPYTYEEVKELALEADNGGLDNATAALNNAGNPINTEAS